ncbi:MAG TPA: hypothetical protein V6D14_03475 [Coleofasciculaceae cyanobacterium]|jgi:hypothetical protein
MHISYSKPRRFLRPTALLLSVLLGFPFFAGCSSQQRSGSLPPVDDARPGAQTNSAPANQPQAKKKGLSTGQKVAILGGAAALYYLYNKHKNKQEQGAQGKYYLSKNGRVYYRDAQNRAHWVTPPQGGIQVPESEAQQYRDFKGYNNSPTGRDLGDVVQNQPSNQLDPVPAQ